MKKNIALLLAAVILLTSFSFNFTLSAEEFKYNPDNYSVPTQSVRVGTKGNDAFWVQSVLAKLGYPIAVDGSFGNGSSAAVKEFQASNGLDADGSVGPATRAKLLEKWNALKGGATPETPKDKTDPASFAVPTGSVRTGAKGNDAYWVQAMLAKLGYPISIDGSFGSVTASVVKQFQKANGLEQDGNVGHATRNMLIKKLDEKNATPSPSPAPTPTPELYGSCGEAAKFEYRAAEETLYVKGSGNVDFTVSPWSVISSSVKYIVIDKAITGLPSKAFENFVNVKNISLSVSISEMGSAVFEGCTGLELIECDMFKMPSGWASDWNSGCDAEIKFKSFKYNPDDYAIPVSGVKIGSSGKGVMWVQSVLANTGYDIAVDGGYGNGTTAAVKAFQRSNGLVSDGSAGTITIVVLYEKWCELKGVSSKPTPLTECKYNADEYSEPLYSIKIGTGGNDAYWVQSILADLGYPVPVDGSYGGGSAQAIKLFQKHYGLSVDGNVGPATKEKLISAWKEFKLFFGVTGRMPYASSKNSNANYVRESHHTSMPARIQSQYYITINLNSQIARVYKKDAQGNPTGNPIRTFLVSTGMKYMEYTKTPVCKFMVINDKHRWMNVTSDGAPCWLQYVTFLMKINSISGSTAKGYHTGFMMHSETYDRQNENTLQAKEWNMLGYPRSHGCIRMRIVDCKWIYDNCKSGTIVEMVNGDPEPGLWTSLKYEIDPNSKRDPTQ